MTQSSTSHAESHGKDAAKPVWLWLHAALAAGLAEVDGGKAELSVAGLAANGKTITARAAVATLAVLKIRLRRKDESASEGVSHRHAEDVGRACDVTLDCLPEHITIVHLDVLEEDVDVA